MVIDGIQVARVAIPLRTPFVTALRRVTQIEDAIIIIRTADGASGHGEAPPTAVITGDTLESIERFAGWMAPRLLGRDIADLNDILHSIRTAPFERNTSPRAAFEIAVYDLWAQMTGLPLQRALGGSKDRLKTDLTISVNPIPEMVRDAETAVGRGFGHLKIKVGKNAGEDFERLSAVQQAVGSRAMLSIDANQGWSADEAIAIMRRLENGGLKFDYLEQPVPAGDLDGLKKVTAAVETPVLADEAVFSSRDAARLLERDAADLINIKLMKSAGISDALHIAALAERYGKECMIGCMLEGPVSVAAAACFAASQNCVTRFDLDGPMLASRVPVEGGAVFDGPDIILPTAPGLGITAIDGMVIRKEYR
ncbi:MAG: dipeptide epimerase [Victivallaceae bacterium]|nr:dipeptide epimerase [Victivallaceae bacterium]